MPTQTTEKLVSSSRIPTPVDSTAQWLWGDGLQPKVRVQSTRNEISLNTCFPGI